MFFLFSSNFWLFCSRVRWATERPWTFWSVSASDGVSSHTSLIVTVWLSWHCKDHQESFLSFRSAREKNQNTPNSCFHKVSRLASFGQGLIGFDMSQLPWPFRLDPAPNSHAATGDGRWPSSATSWPWCRWYSSWHRPWYRTTSGGHDLGCDPADIGKEWKICWGL